MEQMLTEEDSAEQKLTEKDRAVIKYFLLNGNKPSYQKQISKGAGVSEQHLGDHDDKNDNLEKEGRLSKLVREGFLDKNYGKARKRGLTYFFSLKEERKPFAKLANEFLKDKDTAIIFMLSEYTQRMISNEYMDTYKGLNLEEENSETSFGGYNVELFFEKGMKLSPTFLQYTIHAGLPEVEVAANILHSALKGCPDGSPTIRIYLDGWPKKHDITRQIVDSAELLYVSLLFDAKKYPGLRSKIIDFFRGPAFGPPYFNLPSPNIYMI